MKIIDCHTHIYPDAIADKAAASIREFYGLGDEKIDGTVRELIRRGDAAGIAEFVVLPVGMKPAQVHHVNTFILAQLEQQPRFWGLGTVHAAMEDLTEETQWILDSPLKGIKMHPDFQRFPIDDPRLFPVYEMLRGKKPVMFHTGDPRYEYSHPARVKRILELFPGLQVIGAHFGGYSVYEEAFEALKDTDCVFDVSSSLMFMPDGMAERYIGGYGAERLMFGSDFPLWDPGVEVGRFLKLKLTQEQREQIAHKTAERVFGLVK